MLKQLKRWLREWILEEGPVELSHDLDCVVPSKQGPREVTYRVTGSEGLRLVGQSIGPGGTDVRLISEAHAKDKDHFWELWRHHNPGTELRWEDDEPFEPV